MGRFGTRGMPPQKRFAGMTEMPSGATSQKLTVILTQVRIQVPRFLTILFNGLIESLFLDTSFRWNDKNGERSIKIEDCLGLLCYTCPMNITPKLKKEFQRVLWDYSIDENSLNRILEGRQSTFSLNKEKLYARLLVSTPWYKLLDCVGQDGLKEMLTEDVINQIWISDVREKFHYARKILRGLS